MAPAASDRMAAPGSDRAKRHEAGYHDQLVSGIVIQQALTVDLESGQRQKSLQVEVEEECDDNYASKDQGYFFRIHDQPLCHFSHAESRFFTNGVNRVRLCASASRLMTSAWVG